VALLSVRDWRGEAGDRGFGAGREDNEETGPRFLAVSLQVEDIHAVYLELLEKGVVFLGPPEKMAWGGTLAHFKDPDGNVLTLLG
jgi:predicted enzyme related to lactoylglutathione lyase